MKKKSGSGFIIITILVVVLAMILLAVLNNKQESTLSEGLPSAEKIAELEKQIEKGEVTLPKDGFDYDYQQKLGLDTAPIKVVKFGDYKCPACKAWETSIYPSLKEDYIETGKVQFYLINFPFLGLDSYLASIAGEIISEQNEKSFWKYYELMYKKQGLESGTWANKQFILKLVKEELPEIDYKKFEEKLENHDDYLYKVMMDKAIGISNNVNGTPSIFVDGVQLETNDYESLKALIDSTLKEKADKVKESLSGE